MKAAIDWLRGAEVEAWEKLCSELRGAPRPT